MPALAPWLMVALGGAAGSVTRYALGLALSGSAFPLATLCVNALGGFGVGLASSWLSVQVPGLWRLALTTGFMGGFTTFSTFSLETLGLVERGALALAAFNVVLNVTLALGACALGLWAGRALA